MKSLNENKLKLSVIIPVFNEKDTVERAIQRIVNLGITKEIIVIDDCSSDGSEIILNNIKTKYPFTLIRNLKNEGKGYSVVAASKVAKGEYIIVEDSDLELNPEDILDMLKIIEKGGCDMVNGNRNISSENNSNFISKIAKVVTKIMMKIFYNQSVNDLLSSYKLCKVEKFKSLNLQSKRFGFETEWLIKALKNKWKIKEMKIDYVPRKFSAGKKITFKDGLDIMLDIIKYRFQS